MQQPSQPERQANEHGGKRVAPTGATDLPQEEGAERDRQLFPQFDVGRFTILRLVGRGGMGNVFLAEDPVLHRKVALKIPRLDLRGEPELRQRFLREARAMAALSHPNLVPILEIGEDGPTIFLVLAWCDGPNLGEWLARQNVPLAPRFAAELVAVLADAVEYCHRQKIIHRDLKPSNVLLDNYREDPAGNEDAPPFVLKITDFGLARLMEDGLENTSSSLLLGTPQYMAPEQAECRVEDVGPPTDVYALGVILFQMLTRSMPFEASTVVELLKQILHAEPPSITRSRRDVPRHLEVICEKCLQKEPADRYQSVGALAADLRRFNRGEPIVARPVHFLTRFQRWLRKPERLQNAALVVIVVNLMMIAWMLATALFDLSGVGLPLGASTADTIARAIAVAALVHAVPIVLAVFVLRKHAWALPVTIALSAVFWLWVTAILLGMPAPFPGYDEQPALKLRVFSMLEALALAQLVATLLAMRAEFPKPKR